MEIGSSERGTRSDRARGTIRPGAERLRRQTDYAAPSIFVGVIETILGIRLRGRAATHAHATAN